MVCAVTGSGWCQTTSTIDLHRGVNIVALERQDPRLATIDDLCGRTGSPFVAIAQGQRWQTIVRFSDAAQSMRLSGNQGYVVVSSRARTIALTGSPWGTEALTIRPHQGLMLFVHQRPNNASAGEIVDALAATALLRVRSTGTGLGWHPIASPLLGIIGSDPLERGVVYAAILPSAVATSVVLPNSDQPPVALTNDLPVSATVGTTLTLASRSTDADDAPEALRYAWSVRFGQSALLQSTNSVVVVTPTAVGIMVVDLVVTDGLARSNIRQSIAIAQSTTSTINEIQTPLGPFSLNVFGVVGHLPRVPVSGSPLPDNPSGYRIRQEARAIALPTGVEQLGLTRELGYGNIPDLERDPQGVVIPLPLQLSVEAGLSQTADLLVESSVVSGFDSPATTTFSYYAFTDDGASTSVQAVGKGIVQQWRQWHTQLAATARRFTPVSLANLASNRVGYGFTRVHPDTPRGRRRPVFHLHGFDPRSEFAPLGDTFLRAQHRWDSFFGVARDSPAGISPNIAVLEKDFDFILLTYPTTRPITEIAVRLAELYEQNIPEDTEDGVVICYSEGGVVDMAWENTIVRGKRIGDRIKHRIAIAVPYHGASVATALTNRYFDARFFTRQVMPRAAWPLLQYGLVPPSDGLRNLRYDNSWKTGDGRVAYPTLNPSLNALHSQDAFAQSTNVFFLVGATEYDLPLPNTEMETARNAFVTEVEREYSDGVAWTESTVPKDKHGSSKGDTDEFVGWRADGTLDRVGVYWGFDHLQMFEHPDVMCALHRLLAQIKDRSNDPPVDLTPELITLNVGQRSVELTPFASATDANGDMITDHWTFWRTWPDQGRARWDSANKTLTTTGSCNMVMSHVVADGRGMIAHTFVIVYRPMPPVDPFVSDVPGLEFTLRPRFDPRRSGNVVEWSRTPSGGVSQDSEEYDLWIDLRSDSGMVPRANNTSVYGAYRWWSGRKLYGAYQGPALNGGPYLFSNIAVAEPISVHLLDR
ncbi:hypothetical protein HZA86_02095 [Candidatus Uhrbacteria bacterium]|nr:hypothetical protein [Candidatus Uhrbacteria bacterium]